VFEALAAPWAAILVAIRWPNPRGAPNPRRRKRRREEVFVDLFEILIETTRPLDVGSMTHLKVA
jgi:hypothetical protein